MTNEELRKGLVGVLRRDRLGEDSGENHAERCGRLKGFILAMVEQVDREIAEAEAARAETA